MTFFQPLLHQIDSYWNSSLGGDRLGLWLAFLTLSLGRGTVSSSLPQLAVGPEETSSDCSQKDYYIEAVFTLRSPQITILACLSFITSVIKITLFPPCNPCTEPSFSDITSHLNSPNMSPPPSISLIAPWHVPYLTSLSFLERDWFSLNVIVCCLAWILFGHLSLKIRHSLA